MEKYLQINKEYLYETVAAELENMIIKGTIEVGEKLPPETNLAERFGVSRNILREALKILKERGLIKVKSGDGIYVVKPKIDVLGNMVNRLMILGNITIEDLYEFRLILEVKACGLASERINKEEIEKLKSILNNMSSDFKNKEKWANDELEFHLLIAKTSRNNLLYSFLSPISNLLYKLFLKPRYDEEAKDIALSGHSLIIKSLENRDKNLAEEAMQKHIERAKKHTMSNK